MKTLEIRQKFFDFFKKHHHTEVPSSSLIPAQDPTLLFANAGMNQFKDVFLGKEKRSYTRAVSIQKCMRAGGKHNDLDNVGFTKRHLTFFEMMGNFSFGDYFKKDAIQFAWDFLTKEMGFDPNKMYATVFTNDDESFDLWAKVLPKERISRLGEADNFWAMGDTGPCGPCTEIFVDRGPKIGCGKKECAPGCSCDRFLEVWNNVFMQYDRQLDGSLVPLTQTGVDTGMGFERLCVILENKDSVFETEVFMPTIRRTEELVGKKYAEQTDLLKAAFHVLADHIRASCFLIADGCAPSNDGRGYVLRKVIRRAALFAQKLTDKNIFPELADVIVLQMGPVYQELVSSRDLIKSVLKSEIERFAANLVRGQAILEKYFVEQKANKQIIGEQVFKLYDTYGFPLELVKIIAHERGFSVDESGFAKFMEQQQQESGKKTKDILDHVALDEKITTTFTGYDELETSSEVVALILDDKVVNSAQKGQDVWVFAKKSPYFIVGGGQVPDEGYLLIDHTIKAPIKQVRYIDGRIATLIEAPSEIKVGQKITSVVDPVWRTNAMKNHTGTHLLQSALIEVLGKTVKQSGSLVHPDYLRFDFTYHRAITQDEIKRIEEVVNEKIRENIPVIIEYTTLSNALKKGALAFFGDKYNPEDVRLVNVADYSNELCGGTHVNRTGDIGMFKITEETALSAGHRRIFAVTGPRALELFQNTYASIKELSQEFKVQLPEVIGAVEKQHEQLKHMQAQIKQLKKQLWHYQVPAWQAATEVVNKVPYLYIHVADVASDELRDIISSLQQKTPGFYVAVSGVDNSSNFIASVAPAFVNRIDMKSFGAWLNDTAKLRGGGKADMLQGGGPKVGKELGGQIKEWLVKNVKN
ncbi:MAG: alanine--tRNA ligase [Candidatus Babeliales bacterium]